MITRRMFSTAANLLRTNVVHHNKSQNVFEIALNDHNKAVVEYKVKDGIYDLVYSQIPATYQGQGLGGILAELGRTDEALVRYIKRGNVYDLVHANIPSKYRGQAVGELFAERVFDHLVARKQKFKLTCDFLQRYYRKNASKYQDYVVQ